MADGWLPPLGARTCLPHVATTTMPSSDTARQPEWQGRGAGPGSAAPASRGCPAVPRGRGGTGSPVRRRRHGLCV